MIVKKVLDILDFDLPHSKPFLQRLPALDDAFDAEKMKNLLQETLFDQANTIYRITDCKPGKAMYLADHNCNLQFDVNIQDNTTDETMHTLVNARLFQDLSSCKAYMINDLMPLARQMKGRPEIRSFVNPVTMIEPLKMSVSVFPLDGMLPTLISATDSRRMVDTFNKTLPKAITREFIIRDVHLDLAHYGRYQRCVLRYGIDGEQASTFSPEHQLVYGKVDADHRGWLTVQIIDSLLKKLREPNLPYYFRVPISYGYLPDLNLLLMEALPGGPVVQQMVKEGNDEITPWQDGNFTIEEAMEVCARMLLTLHSSGIKLGRSMTLETKAGSVKKEIQTMEEVFPELGDQLRNWVDEILDYAQNYTPMPLCFSHGDYTYTQLIFDGKQGGLVDFDTICQAEPALDLGQFLAYLRLAMLKDHPLAGEMVEHLCNMFLDVYIAGSRDWVTDEHLLRTRVLVYELISLIRLMVHSWKKLKGSRLKLALALHEERKTCLEQIS